MISKCQTVTVAKKKFSDFEYINTTDNVYLVGYTSELDETGKEYTYNIRLNAADIIKRSEPVVYEDLNTCGSEGYDTVQVNDDIVFIFDTENCGTFIQLNDLSGALDEYGYLHIAVSKETAPGTRIDLVINGINGQFYPSTFKGVILHAACGAASGSQDTDILYTINTATDLAPLYISLLELAPEGNKPAKTMCTNVAVKMLTDDNGIQKEFPTEDDIIEPDYYNSNH